MPWPPGGEGSPREDASVPRSHLFGLRGPDATGRLGRNRSLGQAGHPAFIRGAGPALPLAPSLSTRTVYRMSKPRRADEPAPPCLRSVLAFDVLSAPQPWPP